MVPPCVFWTLIQFRCVLTPNRMHTTGGGRATNAIGAEAVADFMFWPTSDREYGWFLEPSYTRSLHGIHEQSLGVSAGLLIPIK
jgi:hypothetical protein